MRRPNYRFERAERNRAKQAKKEEKLRRHQDRLEQPKIDGPDEVTSLSPSDGALAGPSMTDGTLAGGQPNLISRK